MQSAHFLIGLIVNVVGFFVHQKNAAVKINLQKVRINRTSSINQRFLLQFINAGILKLYVSYKFYRRMFHI